MPTFKLEDIKGEETLVFKFVTFKSALQESRSSLLQG